ncbi:MAG: pyridoxal 5'-phosphate synthase glutaminase subunit PdxT [Candidatus Altiarchaeota archaeon]|nr:pyridoxal 5'-phosphate synthase glutaminase subunit PdxT [Candidatus Altiarchaeota archaeon]
MIIGILGVQGNLQEHMAATRKAMDSLNVSGQVILVKDSKTLGHCDGLIIPGGESTTIWKLLDKTDLFWGVKEFARSGKPVFGTCAGLIILAKKGDKQVNQTGQELLRLMDVKVDRNAFGRQKDSFSVDLWVPRVSAKPFHCVFIRAPAVEKVWSDVEVLAKYSDKIVAVRQGNILGIAFHPELTEDTKFHEYFLKMVLEKKSKTTGSD